MKKFFLAIDLPENIKNAVRDKFANIQKRHQILNWVDVERYHINLFFFKDKSKTKEDIVSAIENGIFDKDPFSLKFNTGVITAYDTLSLMTISLSAHYKKPLKHIREAIEDSIESEYRAIYEPHVVIATSKIPSKQQYFHLKNIIEKINAENISFDVENLTLYEMDDTKSKSNQYIPVRNFKLEMLPDV